MGLIITQVDSFTDRPFAGNPAAVCLLTLTGDDSWMQLVAREMNLSETAFLVRRDDGFDLRWMTPTVEMDLCGHATLASAHVLFQHLARPGTMVRFQSRSGELTVERAGDRLVLDFPAQPMSECQLPEKLAEGLGARPGAVLKGRDYFAVFDQKQDVVALAPDFGIIAELDAHGVIVTAPGNDCD